MTESDEGLTRTTVGGLRWSLMATAATLVMQLGYTAIMGRLLEPRLFGLVASAQVVLSFGSYFAEMGLGQALIQKAELTEEEIRAAFTSSVLLGGAITLAIVIGAPAMGTLFGSDDVIPVARALALSMLVTAIGLTSANLLRRDLRFKAIAIIEIVSYVVAYPGLGLVLALSGAGVWSLVAAFLGQLTIKSIASMVIARHGYRPVLAMRRLKSLYAFGGKVSLLNFLEYIGQAIIVVIIGRNAGQGTLGQYNRATLVVELPLFNLNLSLANVLFPTLSRLQGDRDRVRRAYLQSVRVVAALIVPIVAGIAVAAEEIVLVFLGDQWGVAAEFLPAVGFAACFAALSFFGGITAEALGELNIKIVLQSVFVVLLVGGLMLVPSGFPLGYALLLMGAEFLRLLAYCAFATHMLRISLKDQLRSFLPPAAAGGIVALGVAGARLAGLAADVHVTVVLAGEVIAGAILLFVCLTHGPLRSIRRELRDRVVGAYDGDHATGSAAVAARILSIGG